MIEEIQATVQGLTNGTIGSSTTPTRGSKYHRAPFGSRLPVARPPKGDHNPGAGYSQDGSDEGVVTEHRTPITPVCTPPRARDHSGRPPGSGPADTAATTHQSLTPPPRYRPLDDPTQAPSVSEGTNLTGGAGPATDGAVGTPVSPPVRSAVRHSARRQLDLAEGPAASGRDVADRRHRKGPLSRHEYAEGFQRSSPQQGPAKASFQAYMTK